MITAYRETRGIGAAGYKNVYLVRDKLYGGNSTYTVYDLARDLLADGVDWDEDMQIVYDGTLCLTGSLSDMAGMSLSENVNGFSYSGWSKDGRQKYRPFNRDKMPIPG